MKAFGFILSIAAAALLGGCGPAGERTVLSLNGMWQIAKTSGELPAEYASEAPVPGLVDLAAPAIDGEGYHDGWYWHRRTFVTGRTDCDKIVLKVFKARYHTKVYVNGQFAGENPYSFTPSYYDIKSLLAPAGQPNEIVIGVGCKDQLPAGIPDGHDYEIVAFTPGIYDNVEIVFADRPYIENIQLVPDIYNGKLRVVAGLETDDPENMELSYTVSELVSGARVAKATVTPVAVREGDIWKVDFDVDMKDARLWSPGSPFLYVIDLATEGDSRSVRFGMRDFRFDEATGLPMMNGEPYYMRGTNVCIYRFFEDPDRGVLPWDDEWVVGLHSKFKDINWSSMRYCVGFPPERWYDVCDSLGIIMQDEYPLWAIDSPEAEALIPEYRRWMRERWNHPSVVIWDAQNETVTEETGKAIRAVMDLDLSDRPWENGWAHPLRPTDPIEAHPYIYQQAQDPDYKEPPEGHLKAWFGHVRSTRGHYDVNMYSQLVKETGEMFMNPVIVNEYSWTWLNRDGSPTTLTNYVYEHLWNGSALTAGERFEIYARTIAILTEYWRAHRQVVGVLHFCGLGYSRPQEPRGQTSDNWSDVVNLVWEPHFYKYVKPAFSPVGLMVDLWEKEYAASSRITVPVFVINDLGERREQEIRVSLLRDGAEAGGAYSGKVVVGPYGVETIHFEVDVPDTAGDYMLKAATQVGGEEVFSVRDIPVR